MNLYKLVALTFLAITPHLTAANPNPVEDVAPAAIDAYVKGHKGYLDLLVSSPDTKCRPCIAANKRFALWAAGGSAPDKYARVMWSPWSRFPPEMQGFFNRYQINSVPVRLVFRDGQLVDKLTGEPPAVNGPSPVITAGSIRQVKPEDASDFIGRSKGTLVVMLSSFETRCDFCMRANPLFEELARTSQTESVEFVRVMYSPWFATDKDPFAKSLKAPGLPIYLTFQDGQLVRRHNGVGDVSALKKNLLEGLANLQP